MSPFRDRLAAYKHIIDTDIAVYAAQMRDLAGKQYGRYVLETETDVFLDMLQRGGKRIRGALVMVGYEMCGGRNRAMIVEAARAIEMLHAYILIIDDIQDRSQLRRGKATAHEMLATYHREHGLKGDPAHTGISLALMAAISGAHAAQALLASLDADPQAKLNMLSISNRVMAMTAHGQTLDVMNELVDTPSLENIERVLEWKTALYTIINPLHVGMVLAGADSELTDAITPYGLHTGKAFQITDDILGIFGDEKTLGKLPGDDIREGKGTILTIYALQHAGPKDRTFLSRCLGKQDLTPEEFARCRHIIDTSGARAHAQQQAGKHAAAALQALETRNGLWAREGSDFLRDLTRALQDRVS